MRAVRRRRGRGGSGSTAAAWRAGRPGHSLDDHPLGRTVRGSALCGRRTRFDKDGRTPAHERAGGVPQRGPEDSGVIEETLVATGYAADEIDLYVPHQANARILDGIAKKLGVDPGKNHDDAQPPREHIGGFDSLALAAAVDEHRVKEGNWCMEAMGGGFTWGAVLARW